MKKILFVLCMMPLFLFGDSVSSSSASSAVAEVAPLTTGGFWAFLTGNWTQILLALIAIDEILIPLFPQAGIIKKFLSALLPHD